MTSDAEIDTLKNEKRGCGYLKPKSAYLRSGVPTKDGVLPAFVEFDPYVPYLERSRFRSFETFPGLQFELAVTGGAVDPRQATILSPPVRTEGETLCKTSPEGEVYNHLARLAYSGDGVHAGEFREFHAQDLFMFVGASYYQTPQAFIEEVRAQGLSKKIPVTESQAPPEISPGRTRVFLIHPAALDEDGDGEREQAAIIGYVYLTRAVFTEDEQGRYPGWAQKRAAAGELDLVKRGPQIDPDGTYMSTWEDDVGGDDETEFAPPTEEGIIEVLDNYLPEWADEGGATTPAEREEASPDAGATGDAERTEGAEEAPEEGEDEEVHECEHCHKTFDTEMGRRGHMRWCEEKPEEDA